MTTRITARCEHCRARTIWDRDSWMIDGIHDGRGWTCRCCGSHRVLRIDRIEDDGSTTRIWSRTAPRFLPRGDHGTSLLDRYSLRQED